MVLEVLLEFLVEGVFEALFTRTERRTGPQFAALLVGGLLVLGAIGIAVSVGLWYGLAVAVIGIALTLYGF